MLFVNTDFFSLATLEDTKLSEASSKLGCYKVISITFPLVQ